MTELPEEFCGNDPAAIWDEGHRAGQQGRSMATKPFRSGEAERSYRLGKWLLEHPDKVPPGADLPDDPAYGIWIPGRMLDAWTTRGGRSRQSADSPQDDRTQPPLANGRALHMRPQVRSATTASQRLPMVQSEFEMYFDI